MAAHFRRTLRQQISGETYVDLLRLSCAPQVYDVVSILVHSRVCIYMIGELRRYLSCVYILGVMHSV